MLRGAVHYFIKDRVSREIILKIVAPASCRCKCTGWKPVSPSFFLVPKLGLGMKRKIDY
jgi:hypothetical protein